MRPCRDYIGLVIIVSAAKIATDSMSSAGHCGKADISDQFAIRMYPPAGSSFCVHQAIVYSALCFSQAWFLRRAEKQGVECSGKPSFDHCSYALKIPVISFGSPDVSTSNAASLSGSLSAPFVRHI